MQAYVIARPDGKIFALPVMPVADGTAETSLATLDWVLMQMAKIGTEFVGPLENRPNSKRLQLNFGSAVSDHAAVEEL